MKGALQRLRAEVASDLVGFLARVDELEGLDLDAASPAVCAQAAVALHHAYGAVEAALARTARVLEGSVPSGAEWHHDLLHAMSLDIEGTRPRVLSEASLSGLRKLLAFRHFFRHAYAVAWDRAQLAKLRTEAIALRAPVRADFAALDAILVELARSLT